MSLAQSISYALNGRKSGKGYRMQSVCHAGDGKNLYLADSPDGKLIASCFSHQCDYITIMQALEAQGLKPKDEFTPEQQRTFIQKKSRYQLREALQIEMHIALQYLNDRAGDREKLSDSNYRELHPEFIPMPDALFDREKLAYARIIKLIGQLL